MKIEYRTVNITLSNTEKSVTAPVNIPSGEVVRIGNVSQGNTDNDIIDMSVLDNGNEVLKPCDLRFSEPKSAGRFLDSLRPVNFDGGRSYDVKLNAFNATRTNDVTVQVIFAISC